MKIYVISILASSPAPYIEGKGPGHVYIHAPGILPARTIEKAADLAQQKALELWPTSEGWTGHQATIIPITKQFYEAAESAQRAGIIDMSHEEGQTFYFGADAADHETS